MYRSLCCIKRSVRRSSVTDLSPHSLVNRSTSRSVNQSVRTFARFARERRPVVEIDQELLEQDEDDMIDEDEPDFDEEFEDDADVDEREIERRPSSERVKESERIQMSPEDYAQSEMDDTPFGDEPITDDVSTERSATEEYQAALREYRFNLKKRPNRKPFNPLPGVVEIDDAHDLPDFTVLDPAVFDELHDDDQAKIRTHQGLIRLRRNEQKLQRLLSIEKPSKRALLLLLNELNVVQGKDRELHEKYIGPKLSLDQLEDDMDYLWSWGELERSDEAVEFGDTALEKLVGQEDEEGEAGMAPPAETEEGANEDEEGKEKDLPSFTSSGLADDEQAWIAHRAEVIRYKNRDTRQERGLQGEIAVQREEIARLQNLLSKVQMSTQLGAGERDSATDKQPQSTQSKVASADALLALHRASQLKSDRDAREIEQLKLSHPQMFTADYEEDDFTTRSEFEATSGDLNPLFATQSNARSNAEEVEMNDQLISKLKSQLQDTLRQTQSGFVAPKSAKSPKLGAPRPGYQKTRAGREKVRAVRKTLEHLDEKSRVFSVKQEMIAQARAMCAAAGVELKAEDIAKFMADDETGMDETAREDDEFDREDMLQLSSAVLTAEQRITKQKAWLKSLVAKLGEDSVRSMIKQGELPIDTFKGLAMEVTDLAQRRVVNQNVEAQLFEEMIDDQLARFDEIMAEQLAVEPAAIKKALEGGDLEIDQEMIQEVKRERNLPAVLRPENDPMNQFYGHGAIDMMLNENLLELSQLAEARGDKLAARKYELMHQRREQFFADQANRTNEEEEVVEEKEDDDENQRSLRQKGAVLFKKQSQEQPVQQVVDSATTRSVMMPKWGILTPEEVQVNRALIERGDGDNLDYADPELVTSNPFILPSEEGLPAAVNQMGKLVKENLPYEPVDPTVLARNFLKLSPEEQKAAEAKVDEELFEENRTFDEFILGQLPYPVQNKFIRQWKKMSEEQREHAMQVGRVNREEFQHWLDMMEEVRSSSGVEIDTLDQYHIDEPDPKIFNALEGAFWHVGRWQLDERTPEQREAGLKKKIVNRLAPETPDTQVLLDRIEDEMFGVKAGDQTAEVTKGSEDDADDKCVNVDTAEESLLGETGVFDAYSPLDEDPDLDDKQRDILAEASNSELREVLGSGSEVHYEADVTGDPENKVREFRNNPLYNHRTQSVEAARIKRQASYLDGDFTPSGDQRAFDDYYAHFDEEDYMLAQRADPMAISEYAEPMDDQVVRSDYTDWLEKGQHVLSANTREALWQLHLSDPATWTVSALAMKFRISWAHVSGLLHMQAAVDRMKAHDVMDEVDEDHQTEAQLRGSAVDTMKEDLLDAKLRDHLNARGYDGDLMDLVDEDEFDDRTISEDMLHLLPRLRRARSPDVRYVTENEMASVLQQERDVEQRFLSDQAKRAARESEFHRENGPIGATTAPRYTRKADPESDYQHPIVLDALNLSAPINSHLCLTDVTEKRAGRFGMVVRDVTGWLRQPTPLEFAAMRRKELQPKSKFVYTTIPHQDLKTPA